MFIRRSLGVSLAAACALAVALPAAASAAAPPTPTNVRASGVTSSSALLSWAAVTRARSYDVQLGGYRSSTTQLSFNFTQLAACTSYPLSVRSRNPSGKSAWATVTVKTAGCAPSTPSAPTNVRTSNITDGSVELDWASA